jgi:5-hydroxyisourate hydrolase
VDVAHGKVATGLAVSLRKLSAGELLLEGVIDDSGLLRHPLLMSEAISAGGYEVRFAVGDFYRQLGVKIPNPAFLEMVPYQFHLADTLSHYHLPFKFTPWGFSLFRGGA